MICFLFCLLLKLFLCVVLLLCFGVWLTCLVCVLVSVDCCLLLCLHLVILLACGIGVLWLPACV